ncbi:MAG: hypothetical protein HY040_24920 [Planctomycetes bacterium]|nr:hypothetical protein [Planctomycetota bacterium]
MTGASSLAFPGSRTLANWWRQLAPYEPAALWTGYLFLHRVEARVDLLETQTLDRFGHFLLQALDLECRAAVASTASPTAASTCEALQRRMGLEAPFIRQLLFGLAGQGLLRDSAGNHWTLTELGRHALAHERYPRRHQGRRSFTFVERMTVSGQRTATPHFLGLGDAFGVPWDAAAEGPFDPELLHQCLYQPDEWKSRYGFPAEVQQVFRLMGNGDWQNVIVDRPERVLVVLAIGRKETAEQRLLGFAARPDGWVLESREPVLNLAAAARDVLPELTNDAAVDDWRRAWQAWCQVRQLPPAEAGACRLACHGACIRISAPARLIQRLKDARSDLFRSEAWILAGEAYVRQGACLELTATY